MMNYIAIQITSYCVALWENPYGSNKVGLINPQTKAGWFPKVLTYSGYYNIGIKEIWDMVGEYMEFTKKNGYFNYKRNEQAKYWMYESINDTLRDKFYHNPAVEGMLEQTEKQVLNNEISSFVAAKRMIDLFLDHIATK